MKKEMKKKLKKEKLNFIIEAQIYQKIILLFQQIKGNVRKKMLIEKNKKN